jgi:hypothetical protein
MKPQIPDESPQRRNDRHGDGHAAAGSQQRADRENRRRAWHTKRGGSRIPVHQADRQERVDQCIHHQCASESTHRRDVLDVNAKPSPGEQTALGSKQRGEQPGGWIDACEQERVMRDGVPEPEPAQPERQRATSARRVAPGQRHYHCSCQPDPASRVAIAAPPRAVRPPPFFQCASDSFVLKLYSGRPADDRSGCRT